VLFLVNIAGEQIYTNRRNIERQEEQIEKLNREHDADYETLRELIRKR